MKAEKWLAHPPRQPDPPIRLAQLYENHLRTRADDTMLIDDQGPLTYAQFHRMCMQAAGWLAAQGIGPGDRVAVWLINRREWLVLLFALARRGSTLVSLNTRYRSAELEYILGRSCACMLVMQANFLKIDFSAVLAGVRGAALPELKTIAVLDAVPAEPRPILDRRTIAYAPAEHRAPADHDSPDHEVILFTTSGTTKGPKLVMHTPRTLVTHSIDVARLHQFEAPGVRLLAALPLCGVFGMNGVLACMASGAPFVLMPLFDAPEAARLLRDQHITHFYASDEMLSRIAEIAPLDAPFPDARVFGFAAFNPGSTDLASALEKRGFPLLGLYGSSEVQALFALQPASQPLKERALGGGRPAAGEQAQVRIRDPETGELCVLGVAGEIEIQAPGNFRGYLDNPQATADAVRTDGFFRTGDLGYLRPDNTFVYVARMGDTLRLSGFLVDPTEIEYALISQAGVKNAQVVGVTLDRQIRPMAFVIASPGTSAQALLVPLRAALAPFKVPVRVWFVDEFPTTASANGLKIQRAALRQMAEKRLSEESLAQG